MIAEGARVETMQAMVAAAREAQQRWAMVSLRDRLSFIRRLRHEIAAGAEALALAVPVEVAGSLHRSLADTLASEVLPLLEACRFLEREAEFILAPRHESTGSRPMWLGGVSVETRREALGLVLVIGPANYPLFLPGVQVLQALVAGNAVVWKPAPGGAEVAHALRRMLMACGMDKALVTVTVTDVVTATAAMRAGVDKVVLTGSAATGRAVLHEMAETLTPAVMELSGCDAVFVLDQLSANELEHVVDAIAFGLRLNGSATCMAPRRLFVTDEVADSLMAPLAAALKRIDPVPAPARTRELLRELMDEATLYGAKVICDGLDASREEGRVGATLLDEVSPEMRVAQTDIFAPVLSIVRVANEDAAVAAHRVCQYALSATVFGPARRAEGLAARLRAGTVLINDVIVASADPRASFSGRGLSGFGATRGREGLLGMTVVKTILRQGSRSRRAFQATGEGHVPFFRRAGAGVARRRLAGADCRGEEAGESGEDVEVTRVGHRLLCGADRLRPILIRSAA